MFAGILRSPYKSQLLKLKIRMRVMQSSLTKIREPSAAIIDAMADASNAVQWLYLAL